MLYLDYSRKAGEWIPNEYGGRENLEAVALPAASSTTLIHADYPGVDHDRRGVDRLARRVPRPSTSAASGFSFKWNMGWMHDTLDYFAQGPDPPPATTTTSSRSRCIYAFTENFVLPALARRGRARQGLAARKMPGDRWQQLANLRAALRLHVGPSRARSCCSWAASSRQEREWNHDRLLDWHLLDDPGHAGISAAWSRTWTTPTAPGPRCGPGLQPDGFAWLNNDAPTNVSAFLRYGTDGEPLVCVGQPLADRPLRPPASASRPPGRWTEVLNTDAEPTTADPASATSARCVADGPPAHGQPTSARVTAPAAGRRRGSSSHLVEHPPDQWPVAVDPLPGGFLHG